MEFYSTEKLKDIAKSRNFNFGTIMKADIMDISSDIKESQKGKDLWLFFLFAALLFVVAEILLIKLL